MDIVRKTENGKFKYYEKKSKKKVINQPLIDHIKSLKIPPGYKKVVISKNKKSKIQAIGIDSRNRKQYIYNSEYIQQQKEQKFKDLITFGKKIKRIRRDIKTILDQCSSGKIDILSKDCLISLILFLVDKCNFRIGCEKYKHLYKTYGVTTLNRDHFKIHSNFIDVEFVGKKNVINKSRINNKDICYLLKRICNINTGPYLFESEDDRGNRVRISDKHINKFLKKYDGTISVKMFRTWSANYILLKELLQYPIPDNQKDAEKNVRVIMSKAADKMHHTKAVSKTSYMNNKLFELYIQDTLQFKKIVENFRKNNGALPTVDRLLLLFLKYFNDNQ